MRTASVGGGRRMMIRVNALGDTCPIPVVKAKKAIQELNGSGQIEILVDNGIAVQNLMKMAQQKQYGAGSEKLEERKYRVVMTIPEQGDTEKELREAAHTGKNDGISEKNGDAKRREWENAAAMCQPDSRQEVVVVIASDQMGEGDEVLGRLLMRGFLFALTQQEVLPATLLFYNGGAKLTCEGSEVLEDLRTLEAQGVEILTCGTCLDHYGLTDQRKVGGITNMYVIAEKMMQAGRIVKP